MDRAELEEKKRKARVLSNLESHEGWEIITALLETEIDNQVTALQQIGLPEMETAKARFQIRAMRWLLKSTKLATPEQFDKWEAALAFQEKQVQNRLDRGLPADLKDLR